MTRTMRTGRALVLALAVGSAIAAPAGAGEAAVPGPGMATHVIELRRPEPSGWLGGVARELDDSEYRFRAGAAGEITAPNRGQELRVRIGAAGLQLSGRGARVPEGPEWELRLGLRQWGREGALRPAGGTQPRFDGARAELPRAGLAEWYVNEARGLEQGFTIAAPPPGGARGPDARADRVAGGLAAGRAADVDGHGLDAGDAPLVLEMEIGGSVQARAEGAGAVLFTDRLGRPVLRYDTLVVVDATGRLLPASLRLAPGTLSIVVDDRGAAYPLTVDPLMTSPAWVTESDQASAWYGLSVATAGDVNADGFSDILVGAFLFDGGEVDEGKVFLYLGSRFGPSTTPAWTFESNQADGRAGFAIAGLGDLDGDGHGDIVVGGYLYDAGQVNEGVAWVFRGTATGLSPVPDWTLESDQVDAQYGVSVAAAGDVNADGHADLIVGAWRYDNGEGDEGAAFVYLGSPSGPQTPPFWTGESNQVNAYYGYSVATAMDANADGYSDIVVGAYGWDNDQLDEGGAWAYLGSDNSLTPAWQGEGNVAGAGYGWAVAGAGDVDGDGYADILVGAPFHSYSGSTSEGSVRLYQGTPGGPSASPHPWAPRTNQPYAYFGYALSTAGDVNGDGLADVAAAAPLFSYGSFRDGRAYMFLGTPAGPEGSASWGVSTGQWEGQMGIAVTTAGDVNGDGFSDVLVGANLYDNGQGDEGRAYLFYGGGSPPALSPNWAAESDLAGGRLGAALGGAGDVNGDGYGDFVAGVPRHTDGETDEGGVYVWLGSAAGLPAAPGSILQADQAVAYLGTCVATVGDVNGDGFDDILAGAPHWSDGELREGAVFLFPGSPTGPLPPIWSATGNQVEAHFGASCAGAGDINGDGYADLLVAAPDFDNDQVDEGRVFVYLGSPTGPGAAPDATLEAYQDGAQYGFAVASAGDLDGDGYSDIAIGIPHWDHQYYQDNGRVSVFLGSPAGLNAVPTWDFIGLQSNQIGSAVASAGDVNGDGYSDLIMGAPFDGLHAPDAGTAILTYGSATMSPSPLWFIDTYQSYAHLGGSVSSAGDVNGDGFSDVLVGAPLYDDGQTDEGILFLYLGSATGLASTPAWSTWSDQAGAKMGFATAPAGDIDGDGFADVAVAAYHYTGGQSLEGRAWMFHGNRARGLERRARQFDAATTQPLGRFGWPQTDGGFELRASGRSAAGRARVRLEFEARSLGAPFGGVYATGPGGTWWDTGTPGAEGSVTPLQEPVEGLDPSLPHHWQARIASDSIFFPRTPWLSHASANRTETHLRTAGCRDADGDGYGVRPHPACPAAPDVADCDDAIPTIHPGGIEVCDGQDQDCNGVVDDAIPPSGIVGDLVLEELTQYQFTSLTWSAVPTATAYDTMRGDLNGLRAFGGFGGAAGVCFGDGYIYPENADDAIPALGEGFWYLVRPVNCGGPGTYDGGGTGQIAPRDPGLTAAGCP